MTRMADDALSAIVAVLVIALLLGVFPLVADTIAESNNSAAYARLDSTVLLSGNQFVDVNSETGEGFNETVRDSRGFALLFAGTDDSHVSSDTAFNISTTTNWTVSTGVWVNASSVGESNMTLLAVGDPDLLLRYENESGTTNVSAYYFTASDTHRINATLSNPTQNHYVFVTRAGSNLSVYVNETIGESVNVSTDGSFTGNLTASNPFHGRLDETRMFASTLDASQRATLVNDPIHPLPNATRTGRLTYDEGSGTFVYIFHASTDATASNVTWATGYAGQELTRAGLLSDNDYRWRDAGPKIEPQAGGRLDGAPVAYVEYDFRDIVGRVLPNISDGFELAAIIMLVLVASVVVALLRSFNQ